MNSHSLSPKALRATAFVTAVFAAILTLVISPREAKAIPSFARKYQASCQTCHTVYPVLNSFGEAFRRNGYRFPSKNGSLDSDAIKAPTIAMGQDEYKKTFPNSVWPSNIVEAIPLSGWVLGGVTMNFPNSDAHDAAGNVFTWNNILQEAHLFAAGAFNDTLTYMTQLTLSADGVDIETGYLLWNDIIGPDHLVNLWIGRLFAPQLTSYGTHSTYLSDTYMPATSIAGLYNPSGNFVVGQGHSDGIEINGIAGHRLGYSLGWLASITSVGGLKLRNAEEAYAHLGYKIGGVSLDGEGANADVADAKKPWAETSLTIDAFAYHGMTTMDNGTNAPTPVGQNDKLNVVGGSLHLNLGSLVAVAGVQMEKHNRPYPGSAPTPPNPPQQTATLPGAPDYNDATAWSQFAEIDYVVFPWMVPGVRSEYTNIDLENGNGKASLLRVIPGVVFLVRPNVKVQLLGDFELAHGLPPVGSWGAAGGSIVTGAYQNSKFEAETLTANLAWAY
jgi:hypothetical protein